MFLLSLGVRENESWRADEKKQVIRKESVMFRKCMCSVSVVLLVSLTNSVLADWTGTVSSDWYNPANWTGSVPTSGETTLIESLTPIT